MKIFVEISNFDDRFLYVFVDKKDDEFVLYFTFSNEKVYKEYLKNPRIELIYYDENDKEMKDFIKNNKAAINALLSQIKPIYSISSLKDIKTIDDVILDISDLPWEEKSYIINNIATSNTYFKDKYTLDEVLTLDEIKCIYMIIEDLVAPLKDKSQIEQLYSIYGLLKDRPYMNTDSDDINKTRSLNQILYTNPIVCTGYANFFGAMCDALGINNEFTSWQKNGKGHSNNICYVNDSKYDIVGIFAMDVTFDAESNGILHFLYPMDKETLEKSFVGFEVEENSLYYKLLNNYKRYLEFIKKGYPKKIIKREKRSIISKINQIYRLLNLDYVVDASCDIEEEMEKIKNYANVYISPFVLRKIIDIADLEYSLEVIKTSFHYKALTPEDKLMVDVLWNCNRKL